MVDENNEMSRYKKCLELYNIEKKKKCISEVVKNECINRAMIAFEENHRLKLENEKLKKEIERLKKPISVKKADEETDIETVWLLFSFEDEKLIYRGYCKLEDDVDERCNELAENMGYKNMSYMKAYRKKANTQKG